MPVLGYDGNAVEIDERDPDTNVFTWLNDSLHSRAFTYYRRMFDNQDFAIGAVDALIGNQITPAAWNRRVTASINQIITDNPNISIDDITVLVRGNTVEISVDLER